MKIPGNMQAMMQQAQQMQQKMQEEIALIRVDASAGGGMVTVNMDGKKNVHGREDRSRSGRRRRDAAGPGDGGVQRSGARKWTKRRKRRWAACWAAWVCRRECSKRDDSMPDFAEPLARLIQEFKRLPGIGQKSAQRLAFHVLRSQREDAERLAQALLDVKDKLGHLRRLQQHQRWRAVQLIAAIRIAIIPRFAWWRSRTTFCRSRPRASSTACITCCTARFRRCAASGRSSCSIKSLLERIAIGRREGD